MEPEIAEDPGWMGDRLGAFVVAESGIDFTCEIANLTPQSLFLLTDEPLAFREQVSITFFAVEIRGEVALCSDAPRGLLVVFEAPQAIQRHIVAHMAKAQTIGRTPIGIAFPAPGLEEAPATDVVEVEMELIHGLTSHAGQRPASKVLSPPKETVAARPEGPRQAQAAKLDNMVIAPQRKRRTRQRETTDLDAANN
jgi:hypothetical protein